MGGVGGGTDFRCVNLRNVARGMFVQFSGSSCVGQKGVWVSLRPPVHRAVAESDLHFSVSGLWFMQPSQAPCLLLTFPEPSIRVPSGGPLLCARREALKVDGTVCDFKALPNQFPQKVSSFLSS